jgi:hypothetical protein
MSNIPSIVSFDVKAVGEESGKTLEGVFKIKTKLSVKERLAIDERRRTFLGVDAANASNEAYILASSLAYLSVRLVEWPRWWAECKNGYELEDMNVLEQVNNKAMEAVAAEYDKLTKAAEAARQELRTKSESANQ